MSNDQSHERPNSHTGFFTIDLGAFRCAAACGLNPAIAHLILARGTGRDNRITQWSVNAIEQRTGISRPNANKALSFLLDRGIWRKTRGGKHPIYEAVPGDQIAHGPFTPEEQMVLDQIRRGESPWDASIAEKLVASELAIELETSNSRRSFELNEIAIAALVEPKYVWLPNALIDGAAEEVPPVELIRQTRNLIGLRLVIELYALQFLPHFGGAPHEILKVKFDRQEIVQQGPFTVWAFKPYGLTVSRDLAQTFMSGIKSVGDDGRTLDTGWRDVWGALEQLVDLGVVEKVGMLLDGVRRQII